MSESSAFVVHGQPHSLDKPKYLLELDRGRLLAISMNHAGITLIATYDVHLVVLSVVIAIAACYTALDLAGRVTQAQGRVR